MIATGSLDLRTTTRVDPQGVDPTPLILYQSCSREPDGADWLLKSLCFAGRWEIGSLARGGFSSVHANIHAPTDGRLEQHTRRIGLDHTGHTGHTWLASHFTRKGGVWRCGSCCKRHAGQGDSGVPETLERGGESNGCAALVRKAVEPGNEPHDHPR